MSGRVVPAARLVFSPEDRREVLELIDGSLQSGSLTLGPHTVALEEAFRLRHGAPYAVAVNSGTAALEIILRAFGVEGREVVVPTNTFFATAAAVQHAGGIPRFADVAPETMALSVASVEAAVTPATAAVVLVHIGGLITPEVNAIRDLCDQLGCLLIEDAAHAHGSSFDGRAAGSFGHAAAFSFYPTKVITTGEGGMIVTADERVRDEALLYRDQGKAGFLGGDHVRLGYAWRMSELHAAVGIVQLRRLDEFMANRQKVAALYDDGLAAVEGARSLISAPLCHSNYYKYVSFLAPGVDRAEVKRIMRENHGVAMSGEVYSLPLHRQPIFAGLSEGSFPVAEDLCGRHVCLPVHSDMALDEASYVLESFRAVLSEATAGLRSIPS